MKKFKEKYVVINQQDLEEGCDTFKTEKEAIDHAIENCYDPNGTLGPEYVFKLIGKVEPPKQIDAVFKRER